MRFALPLLFLGFGCGRTDSTDTPPQIEEALRDLGEKGKTDDYVIIEAPDSDRFVHFRITQSGGLVADFTIRSVRTPGVGNEAKFKAVASPPVVRGVERILLSQEEVDRLTGVIQVNGLEPEFLNEAAFDGDKTPIAWIQTLMVGLDRKQPERTAEFALEVFQDAYGLDIRDNFLIQKEISE